MEIIIPRDTPAFSFPRGPRPPDFPKTPQSANLSTPRRTNIYFYMTALSATPFISRFRRDLECVLDGTEQNHIFGINVEVCLLALMCPAIFVITNFERHGLSSLAWLGSPRQCLGRILPGVPWMAPRGPLGVSWGVLGWVVVSLRLAWVSGAETNEKPICYEGFFSSPSLTFGGPGVSWADLRGGGLGGSFWGIPGEA